jgi:hypothetical protein
VKIGILNVKRCKICKWSGFNIDKIYKNIPYIKDFISNNNLYILFNVNKEEIDLINEIGRW